MTRGSSDTPADAFTPPKDPNAKVWRYLDDYKWHSFLESKQLWLTNITLFNDWFEQSIPAPHTSEKWFKDLAEQFKTMQNIGIMGHNYQMLAGFRTMRSHSAFVNCWHVNEIENYAMWKLYTTHSREKLSARNSVTRIPEDNSRPSGAVVIQSNYDALKLQIGKRANVGMVKYIDYRKDRLPKIDTDFLVMHKRHYFQFENELRIVITGRGSGILRERIPGEDKFGKFIKIPVDLSKIIKNVFVHPETTSEYFDLIVSDCQKHSLPPPKLSDMMGAPNYI